MWGEVEGERNWKYFQGAFGREWERPEEGIVRLERERERGMVGDGTCSRRLSNNLQGGRVDGSAGTGKLLRWFVGLANARALTSHQRAITVSWVMTPGRLRWKRRVSAGSLGVGNLITPIAKIGESFVAEGYVVLGAVFTSDIAARF